MYGTVSCWLWSNSQYVVIGVGFNLNELLFVVRYTMTPSQFRNHILLNYNHNYTRLVADFDVDWMYGTKLCWLCTNSKYVGIGACLISVSLGSSYFVKEILRCTMTQWQINTRILFNYNCNDTWFCTDVDEIYYGRSSQFHIVLTVNEECSRWYWCMLGLGYLNVLLLNAVRYTIMIWSQLYALFLLWF